MTSPDEKSPSGPRLMDKNWELIQIKTFTKWVNVKIKKSGYKIENVASMEMADGVILATLLFSISNEYFPICKNPTKVFNKIENANKCLDFIKSKNVNLAGIGPQDIVDGNSKLLLGMIWTIILRFSITEISNEGLTAREGLLLWCRRLIQEQYKVKVDNFTTSWADGKAYAALLDSQKPVSFNYDECLKMSEKDRTQKAFDEAENQFMISKLLDVEDVCIAGGPDEKSNMTYIAQYFHAFSENSNAKRAIRRAGNFANSAKSVSEMNHEYEKRTKTLLESFEKISSEWSKVTFTGSFLDIQEKRTSYRTWKSTQKREIISERGNLVTLYSNIQTKTKSFGFKPYSAPVGLQVSDVGKAYSVLQVKEAEYLKLLKIESRKIKDRVQNTFATESATFSDKLHQISTKLSELSGDLSEQESSAKKLQKEHEEIANSLPVLKVAWNDCLEASVDDNDEITHSYDDLVYDSAVIQSELKKKILFVENQLVLEQVSNITPAQLELYETTFRFFDKDNSNTLSGVEFKAALAGLGLNLADEEIEAQLKRSPSDAFKEISLKEFIDFVLRHEEDKSTKHQLEGAFRTIAGGSEYITEAHFKQAGYSTETISVFLGLMKPMKDVEGGYDYLSMVDDTYETK